MAILVQQLGTTAAPLPEPARQVAPAASTGQELGNGIEAVSGKRAGVRNETATSTGTTELGTAARSGAGRRRETVTGNSRETADEQEHHLRALSRTRDWWKLTDLVDAVDGMSLKGLNSHVVLIDGVCNPSCVKCRL